MKTLDTAHFARLAEIAPGLSAPQLRLALHLAATCDHARIVRGSSRTLAKATGLARSSVIGAIRSLTQGGFLLTRPGTHTRPSQYRVLNLA